VAATANGSLVNTGYEGPEARGDWQTVTLNVQSYAPHRIEYYQPLVRENNKRKFSFRWFGDYPVNEFNVAVQLPADSLDVITEPAFADTSDSSDGLHLIGIAGGSRLKMGQSYEFKLEYRRQSETVSKPSNSSNVQPSQPVSPETQGRVSIDNLPWVIGGIGLTLIGLALYFYWRSTQVPERKNRQRRRVSSGDQEDSEEQAYCHECGTRAQKGDRFCRTCGSRLRV
jgi:hypothetical protein